LDNYEVLRLKWTNSILSDNNNNDINPKRQKVNLILLYRLVFISILLRQLKKIAISEALPVLSNYYTIQNHIFKTEFEEVIYIKYQKLKNINI
jgi:hypothetical protein